MPMVADLISSIRFRHIKPHFLANIAISRVCHFFLLCRMIFAPASKEQFPNFRTLYIYIEYGKVVGNCPHRTQSAIIRDLQLCLFGGFCWAVFRTASPMMVSEIIFFNHLQSHDALNNIVATYLKIFSFIWSSVKNSIFIIKAPIKLFVNL